MGFLSSFLGLIGASAVFVGADVKERWDEIDRERQRIAANPADSGYICRFVPQNDSSC